MTSPAPSSQTAPSPNPGARDFEAAASRERHCPCNVSTNPLGFSFIGQFCVEAGAAHQIDEKEATQISTQTFNYGARVTAPHANRIDEAQNAAYQMAIDERREKYLPCYGNFLPLNSALQAGRVSSMKAHERSRSPLEVRTSEIHGTKTEKNTAGNDK